LDDYEDYFEMEDGIIRLNSDVSINELKKLQEENVILEDFDEEFISDVEKVIHNDISFLEIIGINPNIQVYNALLISLYSLLSVSDIFSSILVTSSFSKL
jgi:hypothetical protein